MSEYNMHQKIGMLEEKLIGKSAKIHELELQIINLENALNQIRNPVKFFQDEAEKDGAILNGYMAVQMAKDAETLKAWANSALLIHAQSTVITI
jgi:hypothetical protein